MVARVIFGVRFLEGQVGPFATGLGEGIGHFLSGLIIVDVCGVCFPLLLVSHGKRESLGVGVMVARVILGVRLLEGQVGLFSAGLAEGSIYLFEGLLLGLSR